MLATGLYTLSLIFSAVAAVVSPERSEITFTQAAQEYTLLQESDFVADLGRNGQIPLQVNTVPEGATPTSFSVRASPTTVWRPRDRDALQRARQRSLHLAESEPIEWEEVEMIGPDIEDKHTLAQLARMSGNAYALPGQKSWYDVDNVWNTVREFILYLH